MELPKLALELGLPATATEQEVMAKIAELKAARQEADTLRQENETMTLSAITQAVENGIAEKRIPADKKDHFIGLGKKIGLDELKSTLVAMSPSVKIGASLVRGGEGAHKDGAYTRLGEVPADKLEAMRKDDRETYVKLFKAEYGFSPEFED